MSMFKRNVSLSDPICKDGTINNGTIKSFVWSGELYIEIYYFKTEYFRLWFFKKVTFLLQEYSEHF